MAAETPAENETPEVETPASTEQPAQPKPAGDVPPEVKAALRKANKEAQDLRLKLAEFEDRDKSEAQKLTERTEAAEKRAAELEVKTLRLEVAADKGLTPAQAKRLVGTTRDELESDAAELLETFKSASENERDTVATSLDLGTRGTAAPAKGGPAADFAKFLSGQLRR